MSLLKPGVIKEHTPSIVTMSMINSSNKNRLKEEMVAMYSACVDVRLFYM